MSQPETATSEKKNTPLLIRGAIWIAIGALIAAALVCVIWVLVGDQDGLIGKAFLTILLLAGFAGIVILEAGLAPKRPDWLALASMVTWILALIVGLFKIWMPEEDYYFNGAGRFFQLLLVVGVLQLALLHVRLFTPAAHRHPTTFNRVIYIATVVFLGALAAMLVFYLTFPDSFDYVELYWRIVVALTILAAVGTTLIPLLNALFAPKKPARPAHTQAFPAWPTYADGLTPLPALLDGSPDWNAYYTGQPSVPQAALPAHSAEQFPTVPAPQYPAAPTPQDYATPVQQSAPPVPPAPSVYPGAPPQPAPPQPAPPQSASQPAPPQQGPPAQTDPSAFPPPPAPFSPR